MTVTMLPKISKVIDGASFEKLRHKTRAAGMPEYVSSRN